MFDYALYTLVWFIVSSFDVKRLKCLLNAFFWAIFPVWGPKIGPKDPKSPKKKFELQCNVLDNVSHTLV